MGNPHDATASVYRSMSLRAPEAPSRDELVEVTTAWGDEVLTVTHLRRGEHLALPHAHIDAAACTVTVPEGATAWVLRDGACAPRTGDTFALEAGDCACVLHEGVTLRARRVAQPEPLPAPRRVTGFGAAVACALALASTGAAWASELAAGDGVLARDDTAARRWIIAHMRPWPATAPAAATSPSPVVVYPAMCLCGCCRTANYVHNHDPFIGLDDALDDAPRILMPASSIEVARGPVRANLVVTSGTLPVRSLRRVARRHLVELAQCSDGHTPHAVSIRLVVGDGGRVLATGIVEPVWRASLEADCVASAVRRWSFPASTNDVSIAQATFTLR